MSDLRKLKAKVEPWRSLLKEMDDVKVMVELAKESGEIQDEQEAFSMLKKAREKYENLKIQNILSGEVDENDAFLVVHAGAGGTEAEDWALMLMRMYVRFCERKGWSLETVDSVEGEGGIKSVTLQISGLYAYGYLKGEGGIHRLVRISPFDSNARRHTSFTSVFVYPLLDDEVEVDIKSEDLRVDTYRAGGKGGQHVNKTESAVRFTHLPTGIVVACQSERSQLLNREIAMKMLRSRVYEYYKRQKEEENAKFNSEKKGISWGNQIRSYVFQPYTLVKDHRTKTEVGNIQSVMDGEIGVFIDSYLLSLSQSSVSDGVE